MSPTFRYHQRFFENDFYAHKEVQFLYQIYTDREDVDRVREKERLIEQEQTSWLIKDSMQCEREENELDENEEFEDARLNGMCGKTIYLKKSNLNY